MSLAIGFSGVLYGVNAFILLSSIYGKNRFFGFLCELRKEKTTTKSMFVLTGVGMICSLMPGVSLVGHLSGFIAGSLLFLIWSKPPICNNFVFLIKVQIGP